MTAEAGVSKCRCRRRRKTRVQNAWIEHVKRYQHACGCTYKEALKGASTSYCDPKYQANAASLGLGGGLVGNASSLVSKALTTVRERLVAGKTDMLNRATALASESAESLYERMVQNRQECEKEAQKLFKNLTHKDPDFCSVDRYRAGGLAAAAFARLVAVSVLTAAIGAAVGGLAGAKAGYIPLQLAAHSIKSINNIVTFSVRNVDTVFKTLLASSAALKVLGEHFQKDMLTHLKQHLEDFVKKALEFLRDKKIERVAVTTVELMKSLQSMINDMTWLRPVYWAHRLRMRDKDAAKKKAKTNAATKDASKTKRGGK